MEVIKTKTIINFYFREKLTINLNAFPHKMVFSLHVNERVFHSNGRARARGYLRVLFVKEKWAANKRRILSYTLCAVIVIIVEISLPNSDRRILRN